MKIDFDDLIRQGEDIKALKYLAKELYNNNKIGGTRKRFFNRLADEYEKLEENEAYASLRAIELIKENENLKREYDGLSSEHTRLCDLIDAQNKYINLLLDELDETVLIASSLGWKSTKYEKGLLLRGKIREINWGG